MTMNVFLSNYEIRLQAWYKLRQELQDLSTRDKCIKIDEWWQRCPLVNHYLHPDDISEWPTPWELLNDNNYCYYGRALGMIYTLLLLGINDIDLVEATDYNNNDVVLVLVDSAKYVMNYWPGSVVNITLQDFTVTKRINIDSLRIKIGNV
jgi:hypothetical protein